MITNNLSSPTWFHATSIFIVALTVLQIAAYAGVFALAAGQTTLAPRAKFTVPLVAAAVLASWLAWAVLAVREPVVAPEIQSTGAEDFGPLIKMGGFFFLSLAALVFSKSVRAVYTAIPPAWLIGVQIYRVAGVMFLWPFLAYNTLPTSFSLIASIGDILTGVAAPFVVLALVRNQPRAHGYAVAWNYFGILDLVVAVTAAVLSGSTNIGRFPLVIVQVFIVPVGILAHICSLRNLATMRRSVSAGSLTDLNAEIA